MNALKRLLPFVLLIAFSTPLLAQEGFDLVLHARDGELEGQIIAEGGGPLPGASITVIAPDGRPFTLVTDAEGRFRLSDLRNGEYEVRAELAGFATVTRKVIVRRAEAAPVPEAPFTIVRVYYGTNRQPAHVPDAMPALDTAPVDAINTSPASAPLLLRKGSSRERRHLPP